MTTAIDQNDKKVLEAFCIISRAAELATFDENYNFSVLSDEINKINEILNTVPMNDKERDSLIFLKSAAMLLMARKENVIQQGRAKKERERGNEVVYFLLDEVTQYVKIGRTVNLCDRIKSIEHGVGRKLVLLGTIKGGCKTETKFHQQFSEYRCSGEWFKATPQMLNQIKRLFNHKAIKVLLTSS